MPLPADALVLQHPHTSPFPIHCCFFWDTSSGSSSSVHLPLLICCFHCSASCPKPHRQIQASREMIVRKRETPDKHTELLQSPAGCGCCQCRGVTFALWLYLIVTASNPTGVPSQRSQPLPGSCQPQPCPLPWPRFPPWNGCLGTRENQLRGQVEPPLWRSWDPAASFPSESLFATGGFGGSRAGAPGALTELCRTPHTGRWAQPGRAGGPQTRITPRSRSSSRASPSRDRSGAPEASATVAPRTERVSPLAAVGPCPPPGIPHPRGSRRDSPGGFGC